MRILIGVTGGIAAYKVAMVVRRFKEDGHHVRVIPTAASLNFVGRSTWEALSGQAASSEVFENVPSVEHVRLGQTADVVLIAPATADFIASYTHGQAHDLLGTTLLATHAPVLVAPAMHTEMWEHPATQANVATLRSRGVHVLPPAVGRLTGKDSGPGRLPEPEDIVAAVYALAAAEDIVLEPQPSDHPFGDLEGLKVVVSAGGTREPIDAVRYIGNRSSGLQGFAIAEAAFERGAHVTVVDANVLLPLSEGIERVAVGTAAELAHAMKEHSRGADIVVMAAAVADYYLPGISDVKRKKDGSGVLTLELHETEDVLAYLAANRVAGQTVIGFAAETGDDHHTAMEYGQAKARRKGADLLAINEVGAGKGFGTAENTVHIVDKAGQAVVSHRGSKLRVAHGLLNAVIAYRAAR